MLTTDAGYAFALDSVRSGGGFSLLWTDLRRGVAHFDRLRRPSQDVSAVARRTPNPATKTLPTQTSNQDSKRQRCIFDDVVKAKATAADPYLAGVLTLTCAPLLCCQTAAA